MREEPGRPGAGGDDRAPDRCDILRATPRTKINLEKASKVQKNDSGLDKLYEEKLETVRFRGQV